MAIRRGLTLAQVAPRILLVLRACTGLHKPHAVIPAWLGFDGPDCFDEPFALDYFAIVVIAVREAVALTTTPDS